MSKGKGKQVVEEAPPEPQFTTGKGDFDLGEGMSYSGEWRETAGVKVRHGTGIYLFGKEKYEGSWDNDSMNGIGEYTFSSGAVYKGNFKNNVFDGEGKYLFSDGSSYTGQWSNNKMHGRGTYVNADNSVVEGIFFNGALDTDKPAAQVKAGVADDQINPFT
jgi:hypothetical protein